MSKNEIPPCLIYIDKEGLWFHKGVEMIHREFIRLFYQHMELDPLGRYIINWKGEQCYVEVEDTPFVVRRVHCENSQGEAPARFILFLSDDSQEDLSPGTLYVGNGSVLYCKVKNSTFPARFNRAAYYQLGEHIEEEDGQYYLRQKGRQYFIR